MATINGTEGNDVLFGTGGPDTIAGWGGNDTLRGGAGNDHLIGGLGNDQLDGGAGADTLYGGVGNDTYYIDSAGDRVVEDTADAAGGVDLVRSTISYTLGSGIEHLVLSETASVTGGTGRDLIDGFAGNGAALGDQIDLRDIDANVLVSGNQAFTWNGVTPGGAGTLWYTGGMLYGNVDGDATPEFQIQLAGTSALSVGGAGTDILL